MEVQITSKQNSVVEPFARTLGATRSLDSGSDTTTWKLPYPHSTFVKLCSQPLTGKPFKTYHPAVVFRLSYDETALLLSLLSPPVPVPVEIEDRKTVERMIEKASTHPQLPVILTKYIRYRDPLFRRGDVVMLYTSRYRYFFTPSFIRFKSGFKPLPLGEWVATEFPFPYYPVNHFTKLRLQPLRVLRVCDLDGADVNIEVKSLAIVQVETIRMSLTIIYTGSHLTVSEVRNAVYNPEVVYTVHSQNVVTATILPSEALTQPS